MDQLSDNAPPGVHVLDKTTIDPLLLPPNRPQYDRVFFRLGMNSKALDGKPATVFNLKVGMIAVSPSRLVMFDEGRTLTT